jgi:hypothetical protein
MLVLLDIELEVSLEFFEDTLDAWFRRTPHHSLPRFTITGDPKCWSWGTVDEWRVMNFLSTIIAQAPSKARAQFPAPLEFATAEFTHSPPYQCQASSGRPLEGKLSDALFGLYNLMTEIPLSDLNALQHAFISCLTMKERVLELLDAVRRIQTSALIHYYRSSSPKPFGRVHASSDGIASLVEGVKQLSKISKASNMNSITPDYAIRLLCLGIHLVTPHTARQFTNQWRTLFKVLMDLVYHSLPTTYSGTYGTERGIDAIVYYISQYHNDQVTTDFSITASQCLKYIQNLDSWEHSRSRGQSTAERWSKWLLEFTAEGYAYSDELVEILAAMYFVSRGSDADDSEWWRVKKLGVKERVYSTVATTAQTSTINFQVAPSFLSKGLTISSGGSPNVTAGKRENENHVRKSHA